MSYSYIPTRITTQRMKIQFALVG